MRTVIVMAGLLMVGGCAGNGAAPWAALTGEPGSCAKLSSTDELALSSADDQLADGRPHASLAHLEALPQNLPEVRLRKAKVLRLLGSSEAEPLYRSLLGTCLQAEGEHGLGQLAAARGDDAGALVYLQKAMRRSPTDAKIRNDLGVVYLNLGELEKARFEFLTAIELKDTDRLAAVNLVTLLLYQDKFEQAADLVSRFHLSPAQFSEAQARAEQMKPGNRRSS